MNNVKGYKVFDANWKCMNDFQYKVGETYEIEDTPVYCERGFHFCKELIDCFSYYDFDPKHKVAEIVALGDIDTDGNKCCTNKIQIVKEISWHEVLDIVNIGSENNGYYNSGNENNGNYNTGNKNDGNRNAGYHNNGNRNTGCDNAGDYNTGNQNKGHHNSGNKNNGGRNTGNNNSGFDNSGGYNFGNDNSGFNNAGEKNTGVENIGSWNSGMNNIGNSNSGNGNIGYDNTGNKNRGSYNTGNANIGNANTGDWNCTDFSNGYFNTIEQPLLMFNKPCDMTHEEFRKTKAFKLLEDISKYSTEWIPAFDMTDKEKLENTKYKITGGYLKEVDNTKANQEWWNNLKETDKKAILEIPNFDADIFYETTGIRV